MKEIDDVNKSLRAGTKNYESLKERRQWNSGAIWFNKSDVVSKNFGVEAQTKNHPNLHYKEKSG